MTVDFKCWDQARVLRKSTWTWKLQSSRIIQKRCFKWLIKWLKEKKREASRFTLKTKSFLISSKSYLLRSQDNLTKLKTQRKVNFSYLYWTSWEPNKKKLMLSMLEHSNLNKPYRIYIPLEVFLLTQLLQIERYNKHLLLIHQKIIWNNINKWISIDNSLKRSNTMYNKWIIPWIPSKKSYLMLINCQLVITKYNN